MALGLFGLCGRTGCARQVERAVGMACELSYMNAADMAYMNAADMEYMYKKEVGARNSRARM